MSIVAALSRVLIHENRRVTGAWAQTYRHGMPDGELVAIHTDGPSGTSVTFTPDLGLTGPTNLTDEDLTSFPWLRVGLRGHA